jgi:hypothetical protein
VNPEATWSRTREMVTPNMDFDYNLLANLSTAIKLRIPNNKEIMLTIHGFHGNQPDCGLGTLASIPLLA